ncbi:MAG: biotin--[acetyl-CoA-carboxylase] ligase [Desulfobacterota bacterium]|nr:biotin--[acetyl-CoA-carboxylase] ligase [Thermodesulfobacteriota bacterium]
MVKKNIWDNKATKKTSIIGREILFYTKVDSTNRLAKMIANQNTLEGTVIVADYQTQGEGRKKRKWISPPKKNLLFSVILFPQIWVAEVFQITLLASFAVCKTLIQLFNLNAQIKWPNDIYVNRRKICGILAEIAAEGKKAKWVIVGIGVNVNVDFSDEGELNNIATSVKMETGRTQNRRMILRRIIEEMDRLYQLFLNGNFFLIREEWLKHSLIIGKTVRVFSDNFEETGFAETIDETGALIILTSEGKRKKIVAGEVSLRLPVNEFSNQEE